MNAISTLTKVPCGSAKLTPADEITFYLPLPKSEVNCHELAIILTNQKQSRDEVIDFINRRYALRGYGSNHKLSGRRHETTFTVSFNGVLIGTITLATDSLRGLDVDKTFPEEMKSIRRRPNTKLCELKKFAMDHKLRSRPVLAALFHFVYIYGSDRHQGTDLLIEINPRHTGFYTKLLGFKQVGEIRKNISVDAPSQLMQISVSDIKNNIDNNASYGYGNNLYSHFYSYDFQNCVSNMLRGYFIP